MPWINVLRGGLNAVLAWVSLVACILTYTVHWEWDESHHPHWDRHDYRHAMTTVRERHATVIGSVGKDSAARRSKHNATATGHHSRSAVWHLQDASVSCADTSALQLMAAGVPVAFLAGGGLCWGHLVYAWKTALKFKVLPEGVKFRNIHRFWTEFDVEIASRIGRVWDAEGVLDQTALDVAENVLKVCTGASVWLCA